MFLTKLFNSVSRYQLLVLALSILLFCTPFLWFSGDSIIIGGETFTIAQPDIWKDQVFTLWDSYFGFGAPSTNFISGFYYYLVILLSSLFGISIAQKIIFGLSLGATFLSAVFFFETISARKTVVTILVSLFMVFNPFYIMMFPWFPTYPLLFIVTFSFLAQYVSMVKREISIRSFISYTLLSFLAIPLAANISMFVLFLLLILIFSTWLLLTSQNPYVLILRMLVLGIYFSFIQLFWVIPIGFMAKSLFSGAELYSDSVSDVSLYIFGIVKGITLNQFYFFDKYDSNSTPFFSYAHWYQDVSIFLILLLVLITFWVFATFWTKIEKSEKSFILFGSALFCSGVFLSKGNAAPFGEVYVWMLLHVPLFSMFRSPDIKFPFFALIGLSLIMSRAFSIFSISLNKKYRKTLVLFSFVMISVLGLPILTGDVFHEKLVVSIPQYWNSVSDATKGGSRALLLPKGSSVLDNFTWGYEGRWLAFQFSQTPVINFAPSYGTLQAEKRFLVIDRVYKALENNEIVNSLELFDIFGIDTIIVQNDFDIYKNTYNYLSFNTDLLTNQNSFSQTLSTLDNIPQFSFDHERVGEIDIYRADKQALISSNAAIDAQKIFDAMYTITGDVCSVSTLSFKMSYDTGWQLRRLTDTKERGIIPSLILMPFFSEKVSSDHGLFNDYGNHWDISPPEECDSSYPLVIIYWPQVIFMYSILIAGMSIPVFYYVNKKVFSYDISE